MAHSRLAAVGMAAWLPALLPLAERAARCATAYEAVAVRDDAVVVLGDTAQVRRWASLERRLSPEQRGPMWCLHMLLHPPAEPLRHLMESPVAPPGLWAYFAGTPWLLEFPATAHVAPDAVDVALAAMPSYARIVYRGPDAWLRERIARRGPPPLQTLARLAAP